MGLFSRSILWRGSGARAKAEGAEVEKGKKEKNMGNGKWRCGRDFGAFFQFLSLRPLLPPRLMASSRQQRQYKRDGCRLIQLSGIATQAPGGDGGRRRRVVFSDVKIFIWALFHDLISLSLSLSRFPPSVLLRASLSLSLSPPLSVCPSVSLFISCHRTADSRRGLASSSILSPSPLPLSLLPLALLLSFSTSFCPPPPP